MHSPERGPFGASTILVAAIMLLGMIYISALGIVDQQRRCDVAKGVIGATETAGHGTGFVEETTVFGSAVTCHMPSRVATDKSVVPG